MKEDLAAQDWAYLSKYEEDNRALLLLEPDPNRIVFLGDSITEFWKTQDSFFSRNKSYINRGISGQTTPQMLLRFRADVIELRPKIVVILAGGNDIAGNTGLSNTKRIVNTISSMVELAQIHHIKVVLCSVLPANFFYWNPKEKPAERIKELNLALTNYATENAIPFVDYYAAMVDAQLGIKEEYSEDRVHPNTAGYQIMAPLLEKGIQQHLKTQ